MLTPIFICSITVLAVFIERMFFYRNINIDYRLLITGVTDRIRGGSMEEARGLCGKYSGPLVGMIDEILLSWNDIGDMDLRVRDISEKAIRYVERFGGLVSTIGTVAPMLGLLGTVTGMMKSFSSLASMGPSSHDLLAQGITEALITTALGLLVAIPSIMFYNYMVSKVEVYVREIEYIANVFLETGKK